MSKKVGTPMQACPICGHRARAVYSQKTGEHTCSHCKHTLPLTQRCRRRLTAAKLIYHIAAFVLVLLLFLLLNRISRVLSILVVLLLIPSVSGFSSQLISYYFFTHGKFELDLK